MKLPVTLGALACIAMAVAAGPHSSPHIAREGAPPKTPVYNEAADAKAEIAAAVAKAARDNTRVLVQWGANWCGWCRILHTTFTSDSVIKKELLYEYTVVRVNVGQFDKNMELADSMGARLKESGLPYMTVLDSEGKVLANQATDAFEAQNQLDKTPAYDTARLMAFLKKHQASSPAASAVLKQALARAAESGKPVFLHFGAPWCGWCHKLEEWMAQPAVHAILSKAFTMAKIDTDRMEGGQALLDAEAAKTGKPAGGIPWCEFLAPDGKAIATCMAPSGNIGFPAQPEEIAWFMGMVGKAAPSLSSEDLKALEASLKPAKPAELPAAPSAPARH